MIKCVHIIVPVENDKNERANYKRSRFNYLSFFPFFFFLVIFHCYRKKYIDAYCVKLNGFFFHVIRTRFVSYYLMIVYYIYYRNIKNSLPKYMLRF